MPRRPRHVANDARTIFLRGETLDASVLAANARAERSREAAYSTDTAEPKLEADAGEARLYLLHLADASNPEQRAAVHALLGGDARRASLRRYVPHNTFVVLASRAQARRLRALREEVVVWLGELQPHHKYIPSLLRRRRGPGRRRRREDRHHGDVQLHVLVEPGSRPGGINQLAAEVEDELARSARPDWRARVRVAAAGAGTLSVSLSRLPQPRTCPSGGGEEEGGEEEELEAATQAAAETLAARGDTLWVEARPVFRTLNKFAAMNVQSGARCPPCEDSACPACGLTAARTPVWSALGLRGEDEVVGCGDTGLDIDSCFFWDGACSAAHPLPSQPFWPATSSSHRKLVSYMPHGDGADDFGGHGTHVVGSILGRMAAGRPGDASVAAAAAAAASGGDWAGDYGGMAPEARVAFFDLEGPGGGLDVPDDLEGDYLAWFHANGARVVSNSWGDDSNAYTTSAREVVSSTHTHTHTHTPPGRRALFQRGGHQWRPKP